MVIYKKTFAILAAISAIFLSAEIVNAESLSCETGEAVSFKLEVLPVIERRCSFCHVSGNGYGALILEPDLAYDQIVGVRSLQVNLPRVEPCNPLKSYLLLKMSGEHLRANGSGERMPPYWGSLKKNEYDLVRKWVAQGAMDN